MFDDKPVPDSEVELLHEQLEEQAESRGYHLNPDREFTRELVRGLLQNLKRYGYMSCPCRLASGRREQDLDIICPCDYRDPDLNEFGTCYCALYVTREVVQGKRKIGSIPERRKMAKPDEVKKPSAVPEVRLSLSYPVWRCKVCGYLCAREQPPDECPVCKVSKDRFARFM